MAELNVYYDPTGRPFTVWFGRPQAEHTCEETGEEFILMKDAEGHVIGFERLNYPAEAEQPLRLGFETLAHPA